MAKLLNTKKHGAHWCDYCEPKTTRAKYVGQCFIGFACEDHKDNLKPDDGYMTMADEMTWGRF